MKITLLDGYTLNPGDLSWDALNEIAPCTIYDRTPADKVIERAQGATILLTNKVILNADTINALPNLKYIGVLATGINVVDVEAARKRGIPVTNVPAYSSESVAQMVFAQILAHTRRIEHHATRVRSGHWSRCQDFTFWDTPQTEISEQTLGLIGLGGIGQATARIALAFGMKVIAYRKDPTKGFPDGVQAASLDLSLIHI